MGQKYRVSIRKYPLGYGEENSVNTMYQRFQTLLVMYIIEQTESSKKERQRENLYKKISIYVG
jgi:hypothetical protein